MKKAVGGAVLIGAIAVFYFLDTGKFGLHMGENGADAPQQQAETPAEAPAEAPAGTMLMMPAPAPEQPPETMPLPDVPPPDEAYAGEPDFIIIEDQILSAATGMPADPGEACSALIAADKTHTVALREDTALASAEETLSAACAAAGVTVTFIDRSQLDPNR
jgi:hypothetical protein